MARGTIRRFSDGLVQLVAPLDYSDPSVPAVAAGTSTFRLYNDDKRTQITSDAVAGATVISISYAVFCLKKKTIAIRLDDTTTIHSTTVVSKSSVNRNMSIANAIPAGRTAKAGAWVQVYLGSSSAIAMTSYGTPATARDNWGYVGVIPDTLELFNVNKVGIETEFIQSVTGNRLFKRRTEMVVEED